MIARDRTGTNGSFELQGEASDLYGNIDPRFRLFHRNDQSDILPHVSNLCKFVEFHYPCLALRSGNPLRTAEIKQILSVGSVVRVWHIQRSSEAARTEAFV